jgi:hypothetical protein
MVSSQLVLEFVNTALDGGSAVIIAPYFQSRIVAIGNKNPKHVTGQINELTTHRRLVGLELFAHHHKAPLGFPVPKFEAEFAHRVDGIHSLPLSDLTRAGVATAQPTVQNKISFCQNC